MDLALGMDLEFQRYRSQRFGITGDGIVLIADKNGYCQQTGSRYQEDRIKLKLWQSLIVKHYEVVETGMKVKASIIAKSFKEQLSCITFFWLFVKAPARLLNESVDQVR